MKPSMMRRIQHKNKINVRLNKMSKNNKDVRISAYVEIDYALEINRLAREAGVSVSEWARQVLIAKVEAVNENNIR